MTGQTWNPQTLLELSGSYWTACTLHAGVKLGIFSALGEGAQTARQVAEASGADEDGTERLLHALTAMGLLIKGEDGRFANSAAAAAWLVQDAPGYLGHILLHHHHLMESWAHLDQAVQSGRPLRGSSSFAADEWRESFLLGMFNLAMQLAPQLVPQIDLRGRKRLLDFGGGPGTYALHYCQAHPELQGVIFDLPTSRPFAEQTIERFGLQQRVSFAAGDFLHDAPPGRFDVAWLSHVLHGEDPRGCRTIIARAVAALDPGGMILIHEFILDNDRSGPLFPALFSLNMLLGTEGGRSYTEAELFTFLREAGVGNLRRLPLDLSGPSGVIAGQIDGPPR